MKEEDEAVEWSGSWVSQRLGVELVGDDGLKELLGLALRRNPKRAHLLVSHVLGKHVPQKPSVVYGHGYELGVRVRELLGREEAARAVVLGYAETATGLGHSVADGLALAPYLHSTRRPVDGVGPAGGFEESHSHATSHLLLPEDPKLLAGDGPLVLVDDEFSTGNTVLNTIRDLHARHPRGRYVIVALVDMRSARDLGRLDAFAKEIDARIDLVAHAGGTVRLPDGVLEKGQALVAAHETATTAPAPGGSGGAPGGPGGSTDAAAPAVATYRSPAAPEAPEGTDRTDGVDGTRGADRVDGADGRGGPDRADGAERATGPTAHRRPGPPGPYAPHVVRVDLDWPSGVPDGGRHGFTPAHRVELEAALPAMAQRVAEALGDGRPPETVGAPKRTAGAVAPPRTDGAPRVLVLGFEELMYAPLRLALELERTGAAREVRYSTTTRSPVLAVDDPGYAIRNRLVFPAHDEPADGPGERYAYNVAGGGFDAVVAVVDSAADTAALHAPDGLLAQLAAHIPHVVLTVVPSYVPAPERDPMPPEPLRGPEFSSYAPDEVGWLLQDLSDVELEAPTEEREEAIQSGGAHYAESLPVEYQPSDAYQALFHAALETSAARIARAVGAVTDTVLAEHPQRQRPGTHPRESRPVLVSLARAGTPVGVLMRRWARHRHGLDLPHYAVSIVRGRGIDANALRWLAAHHHPADVVFVDGWTGKGAITRELAAALGEFDGFVPEIAVLADPGGCVRTYGTREDFLIPSACLNSTVSGLVSRTVLRTDLVGPHDFHGAKYYRELAAADVSGHFLDTVEARFDEVADAVDTDVKELLSVDRTPTWAGWAAVERISEEYGIHDVNLVKPGVGETTRVLLRRVPWKILAKRGAGADLDHVRLLAEQRGVPVEETDDLPYSCVGLVHPRFTRGATGADGKAVAAQ
ncbi:phosphoribosyltransferase domain-containing protein [Streptomyces marianii]|uniref:Phosphoribosyltransferase n=1 Tax=Streptomyces marianii TaxID=1817406 RepID=A0A5R9EBF7_9ACTN|nr:phosphoribosyltransferase domain-containing protein [Streptomyces marianii]TLQ46189.1 phosphoribosyltransferase [Streptomyces marianii]